MSTFMAFHEVDNVDHWVSSPKREEIFGPMGISFQTFVDPNGSNRVGLIAEIPDIEAFQAFLGTDVGAAAMAHDGVRPETIVILAAS